MAKIKFFNVAAVPTTTSPEGKYHVKNEDGTFDTYIVSKGSVKKQNINDGKIAQISGELNIAKIELFREQLTPSETRRGYYLTTTGVLSGGSTFANYFLEVYPVTPGQGLSIIGTTIGNVTAYGFYPNSNLTGVLKIGKIGTSSGDVINVNAYETVPNGAFYLAITKINTHALNVYSAITDNKISRITQLEEKVDSTIITSDADIKKINQIIYGADLTLLSTSDIRTGYYINNGGALSGGGTFANYFLEVYPVTPGQEVAVIGTFSGNISAFAYFANTQLTSLVKIGKSLNISDRYVHINMVDIAPANAAYVVLTKLPTLEASIFNYAINKSLDKITELGEEINTFSSDIQNTKNEVFGEFVEIIPDEIRTGYYVLQNGNIVGGGTFSGYNILIYNVLGKKAVRLIGEFAGSILTHAFYSNDNLTAIVATGQVITSGQGTVSVNKNLIIPNNAKWLVVTSRTSLIQKINNINIGELSRISKLENKLLFSAEKIEIECIGDSLTAASYPTKLQMLLGNNYTVINLGVGGENSRTIAARQGGEPASVVAPFTIPETTTPVVVSLSPVIPTRRGQGKINPCMIEEISGTLEIDTNNIVTFTRLTAGNERIIAAGSLVVTNIFVNNRIGIPIIYVGTNDGQVYNVQNNIDTLITRIKKMLSTYSSSNYVVISTHAHNITSLLESSFTEEFGIRHINLRKYMAMYGIKDAIAAGLLNSSTYPTQADINAMNAGNCPPSLLSDGLHFTDVGYQLLANQVYQKLIELGVKK